MPIKFNFNNMLAVRIYERTPINAPTAANSNYLPDDIKAVAYYVRDIPTSIPNTNASHYELNISPGLTAFQLSIDVRKQNNWGEFDCESAGPIKQSLHVNFNVATHVLTEFGSYCDFSVDRYSLKFGEAPIAYLIRPYDEIKELLAKQKRMGEELPHPEEPEGKLLRLQQPQGYS